MLIFKFEMKSFIRNFGFTGMIYIEPSQLGWRPFKESYLQYEFPTGIQQADRDLVNDLFEWLGEPCLEFIRLQCKMLVRTTPIHLVRCVMKLYSCLLDEVKATAAQMLLQAGQPAEKALSDEEKEERAAQAEGQTAGAQAGAPGGQSFEQLTPQQITLWLQGLFLFSIVWGIGGVLIGIFFFFLSRSL